jgi:outer membrane protein assembly factor BamB
MDASQPPDKSQEEPTPLSRRAPLSARGDSHSTGSPGPAQTPPGPPRPDKSALTVAIPAVVGVVAVLLLGWWLMGGRGGPEVTPRLPSPKPEASAVAPSEAPAEAEAGAPSPAQPGGAPAAATTTPGGAVSQPQASGGTAANIPGEWIGFRGNNRDNIATDKTPLAKSWGPGGPKALWSVDLGEGYAGPAVAGGRVYLLDYDQGARADTLRCLSLADGKEIWRNSYPALVKRNHGMSRTVPSISGKYVVTLGPLCHVTCWDADSGAIKWKADLVSQYGTAVPEWYAGQCPLIDGGRVILATGGKALFVALDLASGKVLWQTPNPSGWQMSHSSICVTTFNGKKMYVYTFKEGVAAVSADGSLLWETGDWRVSTATIPMPVPVAEGRLFLSGGYNAGSAMLELKQEGGEIRPRIAFRLTPDVFSSHQHTPILHGGHIYGVIQSGELVCLDPNGKKVWSSGPQHRFGLGPYLLAQGMLYVLSDDGVLSLVEASTSGYKQLAQAKILDGPEVYGPMALVSGRLLARSMTKMVCLDVSG